jgi:hypothetical protein
MLLATVGDRWPEEAAISQAKLLYSDRRYPAGSDIRDLKVARMQWRQGVA